jgi:5-formyltetrahydrofolate cyclo-ligase
MYWPVGAEPDLRALAQNAATSELALPAVVAGQLLYRAWRPGEALVPDACRIPAPAGASALKPDDLSLLLVPALALDQHGIRLGSGGGWYDRLRADPAWRAIPALAVLPTACITRDLPRDPWDVPFDGWLDERGLHWLLAV